MMCKVRVDEQKRQLVWQYSERRFTQVDFKDIEGLVYGAFSFTFLQYKADILKAIQLKNAILEKAQSMRP